MLRTDIRADARLPNFRQETKKNWILAPFWSEPAYMALKRSKSENCLIQFSQNLHIVRSWTGRFLDHFLGKKFPRKLGKMARIRSKWLFWPLKRSKLTVLTTISWIWLFFWSNFGQNLIYPGFFLGVLTWFWGHFNLKNRVNLIFWRKCLFYDHFRPIFWKSGEFQKWNWPFISSTGYNENRPFWSIFRERLNFLAQVLARICSKNFRYFGPKLTGSILTRLPGNFGFDQPLPGQNGTPGWE